MRFRVNKEPTISQEERDDIVARVIAGLEDARQYARSHGGDISLVQVDHDLNVFLRFQGACRTCPLTEVTLRLHIEGALRDRVPDIRKVLIQND